MNIKKFLNKVSYIDVSEIIDDDGLCYYSNFDKSYITRVGMESNIEFLAKREITEELTHGIGFSLKDNKWYGWSHRAIYGFEIGSTCKKGDCHYNGSTLKEQEQSAIEFWEDENHIETHCNGVVEKEGEKYFDIEWTYNDKCRNKSLHGTISGCLHHIKNLGRGEWVAKTMEDAKQMAIDFNKGVS